MKWEDNSVLLYNSKFLGEHNAFVRDCKSIKKKSHIFPSLWDSIFYSFIRQYVNQPMSLSWRTRKKRKAQHSWDWLSEECKCIRCAFVHSCGAYVCSLCSIHM